MDPSLIREPPKTFLGTLKELGPGLIVAAGIVGSGELIATTATGAEAGFWLMWLIIVGCVIKVFVQVEIGRYVILTGRTTLEGINSLPGFRFKGVHWIAWFWLLMYVATTAQQGGIIGGVGQALSISAPITEQGVTFNDAAEEQVMAKLALASGEVSETQLAAKSWLKVTNRVGSSSSARTGRVISKASRVIAARMGLLRYRLMGL